MKTLQDHVLQGLERRYGDVIVSLSEWSLMCMTAVRSRDFDCNKSIALVTGNTLIKLLDVLQLEADRPWTTLAQIRAQIRQEMELPHRSEILSLNDQIEQLKEANAKLTEKLREAQLLITSKIDERKSMFGFRNK